MTGAARGYRLVLPPGWVRIPVRSGTEAAVDALLDEEFEGAPGGDDRGLLRRRLLEVASGARRAGGLDAYLPVQRRHGCVPAASFVVSEISIDSLEPSGPAALLARLAAGGPGGTAVVDGAAGFRRQAGTDGARRVDYVLPVPGDPGRWVIVGFATAAEGAPGAALVELFEAIMSTYRWERAGPE